MEASIILLEDAQLELVLPEPTEEDFSKLSEDIKNTLKVIEDCERAAQPVMTKDVWAFIKALIQLLPDSEKRLWLNASLDNLRTAMSSKELNNILKMMLFFSMTQNNKSILAIDFRRIYHMSIFDVGSDSCSYEEGLLLIMGLEANPMSFLYAIKNESSRPFSYEEVILADTYDLLVKANSGKNAKPKPYPRPYKYDDGTEKIKGTVLSWEESDKYFQFHDTKTKEEIRAANEEFLRKEGGLKAAFEKNKIAKD